MGMYSSGGGNSTSTTKVEYSPAEQQARDTVMNQATAVFNNAVANGGGTYPGAVPVGPSPTTQQGWQWDTSAIGRIQNGTDAATAANNFGLRDALYADSNPYLQSAMNAATRPMVEQFMGPGGALQRIREGGINAGTYGSSRSGIAEGIATRGLENAILDKRALMASDAYNRGLEVQQNAVKNQAMLNMMQQVPGEMLGRMGGTMEGYSQQQANYDAAARDFARNAQWEPLQNFANIIYGGSNGTTSQTQSLPRQDNTGQVVGSLGSAALMAFMLSDRRLKTHITRLATHAKGFGIYLYKIFGEWQVGVLAQEVEKILPRAVALHPSGYKMVNYSMLGA